LLAQEGLFQNNIEVVFACCINDYLEVEEPGALLVAGDFATVQFWIDYLVEEDPVLGC
jgi:hypothetical protein